MNLYSPCCGKLSESIDDTFKVKHRKEDYVMNLTVYQCNGCSKCWAIERIVKFNMPQGDSNALTNDDTKVNSSPSGILTDKREEMQQ